MAKFRNMKFEEALARLDEIVNAMESGELGIEESVDRYEEAMALAARCREVLEQAELRVRKIQMRAGGEPEATPLDAPLEADGEVAFGED